MLLKIRTLGMYSFAVAICAIAASRTASAMPLRCSNEGSSNRNALVFATRFSAIFYSAIASEGISTAPEPHLRIVEPRPFPEERQRLQIIWGGALLLTLLCYITTIITIRSVKRLSKRIDAVEASIDHLAGTAEAVHSSSRTAIQILRPWVAISFEPVRGKEGLYGIIATNRGTSPAQLVGTMDRIGILTDESYLPTTPEYAKPPRTPSNSVILIPGDTALLQTFGRSDLSWVCKTPDQIGRIESGHDKVIIYGRVLYRSSKGAVLSDPPYETGWCCRYVHNDMGGALIKSGPSEYRTYT